MPTEFDLDNLAIFDGTPLFSDRLHVNQPWLGDRAIFDTHMDKIWDTKWITNSGPLVEELECRLAEKLGVQHCILMSSGTIALAVLLRVLGVKGEVILPSFTFVSTPHTLLLSGLKPVFCDINLSDRNMNIEHCESLITEATGAILPTHIWGHPCDVDAFTELTGRNGLPLIFDAAHAFGCKFNGRAIGSFGDAEVFSFHATKSFHTGEGGAVSCNDGELANKLRLARNFGFLENDRVAAVGTNAKMSELSAAMGLTNLSDFDASVIKNKLIYYAYREHLKDVPCLSLNSYDENQDHNYWYISLEISEECPVSRDNFLRILHAENIIARRYFFPGCHNLEPYRTLYPQTGTQLQNTTKISNRVLLLPGGSNISVTQVHKICDLLSNVLCRAEDIANSIDLRMNVS